MKRAPRSRQRHDLYAKYHDYDSEISDLLGECGMLSMASAESFFVIVGAIAILIDWYRADRWSIEIAGIDRTAP